ncbi:MAG: glycosyltransferase, partial [Myxococcota bacterium]
MRVALLTNGLGFGGAERIVEALADDLRAAGDAVEVWATTRGGPIADGLRSRGHAVHILGIRSALDLRVVRGLREHERRFRPDLVHSHLAVSDIASALAGSGPVRLSTVHNPGFEVRGPKRWLWQRALPRLDAVCAVSRAAARQLRLPARVLRPSLVDLDTPSLPRVEARVRLGLDTAAPLVLAVGRLT